MYSPAPLTKARIAKTKSEVEFIQLKSSILRGDHLHRQKLESVLTDIVLGIRQVIEGSKLTQDEKEEIFQNLSQLPIAIAQTRQAQRRALAKAEGEQPNGGNGD
jgi:hypothetical protein